jgi:hypothetical protein
MRAFGNVHVWIGLGLGETVLPAETSVEEWRAWLGVGGTGKGLRYAWDTVLSNI